MKKIAAALFLAAPLVVAVATPAAAEEAAVARLNLDTPIETIYADPEGAKVLEANMPGMNKHEMYDMFKAMSLRAVQPFTQGMITEAMLAKIETELAAIK